MHLTRATWHGCKAGESFPEGSDENPRQKRALLVDIRQCICSRACTCTFRLNKCRREENHL